MAAAEQTQPVIVYSTPQPQLEIADIFRQYGEAYRREHRLTAEQHKAMQDVEQCRTAALGGHVDECTECGTLRISYNSCRNRHCPKCGSLRRARWLEARKEEWLPIEYFHVVFTLDHALNPLVGWNEEVIYNLLFRVVSETLQKEAVRALGLAEDEGEIGIIASLHTWGQDLGQHIHLHCIVTGGALQQTAEGPRWQACRKGYLVSAVELSAKYREAFCAGLQAAYRQGKLRFGGGCDHLAEDDAFDHLVGEMRGKKWNVYIKETFGNSMQACEYLGKDLNRGAFANHRLTRMENGQVSFRWRDNQDGERVKEMTLSASEFIRRWLTHVLPKRFVRMRYYGLWGGSERKRKLAQCRACLQVQASPRPLKQARYDALLLGLMGVDVHRCPVCGRGQMVRRRDLPAARPVWTLARASAVEERAA